MKIIGYEAFKYGEAPLFDGLTIVAIPQSQIKKWRESDNKAKARNRKQGAEKAARTKVYNQKLKLDVEFSYDTQLQTWQKLAPETLEFMVLAYWTAWVNRWAKFYQFKE